MEGFNPIQFFSYHLLFGLVLNGLSQEFSEFVFIADLRESAALKFADLLLLSLLNAIFQQANLKIQHYQLLFLMFV
jgi:hypothetical protein